MLVNMKRALITGILGQDGAYLAQFLLGKGYRVYGVSRRYSHTNTQNLDALNITQDIFFLEGDLTDKESLLRALSADAFDEIYNLGAQSFVSSSWPMAEYTTHTNALGPLYVLDYLVNNKSIKLYQASTSEMFGNSHTNGLQNENTPFAPRSPYGVAKLYAHEMVKVYRDEYGLFACNGILFNHESPLRGEQFVTQKIATGLARITMGLQKTIELGNLDARRDWGYAGDYVEAMWLMLQQNVPNDYVIGMGENHTVREFLDIASQRVGIHNWKDYVVTIPSLKRVNEVHSLKADPVKATNKLGWKPKTSFEQLVNMMVDHALVRAQAEKKS